MELELVEAELVEVELEVREVLEVQEVELLLCSLVRNFCRMGRRHRLEEELLHSCAKKSWLHQTETKLRRLWSGWGIPELRDTSATTCH